jgi:hypothetical protein
MFLLFLTPGLSIVVKSKHNVSVMVGALSHPRNPLWSQPVPGIHFCPSKPPFPFEYSFLEHRIILPILTDQQLYLHCALLIDDSIAEMFDSLSQPQAFLRFYVGLTTARGRLFDRRGDGLQIGTVFEIAIHTGKDSANPKVRIEVERYLEVEIGRVLNFSFVVRLEEFDRYPKPAMKHPIFWVIGGGIFVVGLVISGVFIWNRRRETRPVVPYGEIWRVTPELGSTKKIASFGCSTLISAVIALILVKRRRSIESVVWVSGIAGWVLTGFLIGFINRTSGLRGNVEEVRFPGFVYYFLFIFPHRVFAFSFDSLRGYPVLYVLFWDGLFLGFVYVFSFVLFKRGRFSWTTVESQSGPPAVLLKPLKWGTIVWDIVYVLVAWGLCSSVTEDVLEVVFDDRGIPYRLYKLATFFYIAMATLRGVNSARRRTTRRTRHWTRDHVLVHAPVAVAIAGGLLVQTFQKFPDPEWQVLAAVISLVPAAFGIVLSVGTLCSFTASFLTVVLAFAQPKIS